MQHFKVGVVECRLKLLLGVFNFAFATRASSHWTLLVNRLTILVNPTACTAFAAVEIRTVLAIEANVFEIKLRVVAVLTHTLLGLKRSGNQLTCRRVSCKI